MDFDDLLGVTVELLQTRPEVLADYQDRFRHVLVDEYQDTNVVQNDLVMLLGEEHRNVCVVGDSDQSVYRFRGADMRNILEFETAFPDATVVVLEQNYRSTQTILDAANAVISHNLARKPKDLWTESGSGDKIVRFQGEDEADEAQWITRRCHACTTVVTCAGPTWRCSTGPTRRAGCSRSSSSGPASRTGWSAARGSTTAARSRTRWPT